jgi:hypothetical protein
VRAAQCQCELVAIYFATTGEALSTPLDDGIMRYVVERPETRYALNAQGQSIAFQVCGHGPIDVVYVPKWASPIDLSWDHPLFGHFLHRLSSFSRLMLFDKRGSGSSDHVAQTRSPRSRTGPMTSSP